MRVDITEGEFAALAILRRMLGPEGGGIRVEPTTRTMGMRRGCVVNPNRVLAEQVVRIELSLESPSGDAEHVYKTLMAVAAGRKDG